MTTPAQIEELKTLVEPGKVLTDADSLEAYGKDWTKHFAPAPSAIVFPKSIEQVQAIVRWANAHRIALTLPPAPRLKKKPDALSGARLFHLMLREVLAALNHARHARLDRLADKLARVGDVPRQRARGHRQRARQEHRAAHRAHAAREVAVRRGDAHFRLVQPPERVRRTAQAR